MVRRSKTVKALRVKTNDPRPFSRKPETAASLDAAPEGAARVDATTHDADGRGTVRTVTAADPGRPRTSPCGRRGRPAGSDLCDRPRRHRSRDHGIDVDDAALSGLPTGPGQSLRPVADARQPG